MKRFIVFLLSCLATVPSFSWGLHRDFVRYNPQRNSKDYRIQNTKSYSYSPLYAILREHKTQFTVCIKPHGWVPDERVETPEQYGFRLLSSQLNSWFNQAHQTIEHSGRQQEFQDILSWLPAQLQVRKISCDPQRPADITLDVSRTHGISGRAGWYAEDHRWFLNLAFGFSGEGVAQHELGHFFGLADLGDKYHGNADDTYSLASVGVVPNASTGVMWWNGDEGARSITCDDVEGFLNAVDFVQFMEGETSPRLENGWKSLCGKPYYYLRGRVARSPEEFAQIKEETESFRLKANVVSDFQSLRQKWISYQDDRVRPLLEAKTAELTQLSRPLDRAGLMLSAQVHFLQNLDACISDTLDSINDGGNAALQRANEASSHIQQQLQGAWCSPAIEPLSYPRLLKTRPLENDFPSGHVHKCATCGQDIAPGEEEYHRATFTLDGKKQSKVYYTHTTCAPLSSKKALLGYRDNPATNRKVAPTYEELKHQTAEQDISVAVATQLRERR